jgi:hypothetical protein
MSDCTADISRDCGPTSEGSFVCSSCARVLRNDLRELPSLAFDLEVTLTRMRGTDYASRGDGGHGGEKPLPLHAGAYATRDVLRNTLSTWARVLVEQGARYSNYDDAPSIARWLSLYLDQALRSEWAPEFADEVHAVTGEVRRCVDIPAEKMWLGPCNEVGRIGDDGTLDAAPAVPDGPCGIVYAHERDQWARCNTCGATFDVAVRQAYVSDQLDGCDGLAYTPAEIAHILSKRERREITSATVRGIIHRNRAKLGPPDSAGRYLLGDVRALMIHRREKVSA